MNNEHLLHQALQRQNDRTARLKMPSDMEQRVMRQIKHGKAVFRWIYPISVGIVAASVLLLFTFVVHRDADRPEVANTVPIQEKQQLAHIKENVRKVERTDSGHSQLVAVMERVVSPIHHKYIYSAMLPEVVFCAGHSEVQLPQVSKQPSFGLVCKFILPEVMAYTDSTVLGQGTEIMVACDEIEYNDNLFKNVSL